MKIKLKNFILIIILLTLYISCSSENQPLNTDTVALETEIRNDWPVFRGNRELTGFINYDPGGDLSIEEIYNLDDVIIATPVAAEGKIFICSDSGNIYAWSLEQKQLLWTFSADDSFQAPCLLVEDYLYAASMSGIFYKIDSSSGEKIWSVDLEGRLSGSANFIKTDSGFSLYIGSYNNQLININPEDGSFQEAARAESYINGSVTVWQNRLIAFAACDGYIYLYDTETDQLDLKYQLGNYIAGSAVISDNNMFAAPYSGKLISLNIDSQKINWEFNPDSTMAFVASPSLAGSQIIIGNRNGIVYSLDSSSGNLQWQFATGAAIESSVLIAGEKVLTGSLDGYFYVLDRTSGEEEKSWAVKGIPYSSPIFLDGIFYFVTDTGSIYQLTGDNKAS